MPDAVRRAAEHRQPPVAAALLQRRQTRRRTSDIETDAGGHRDVTNARSEATNAKVQWLKRLGGGYRERERFGVTSPPPALRQRRTRAHLRGRAASGLERGRTRPTRSACTPSSRSSARSSATTRPIPPTSAPSAASATPGPAASDQRPSAVSRDVIRGRRPSRRAVASASSGDAAVVTRPRFNWGPRARAPNS